MLKAYLVPFFFNLLDLLLLFGIYNMKCLGNVGLGWVQKFDIFRVELSLNANLTRNNDIYIY